MPHHEGMASPDYDRDELLSLLQALDEDEEFHLDALGETGVPRSIIIDRRAEKEKAFQMMCYVSLPFYAKYVLNIKVADHHKEWSDLIVRTIDLAAQPDRVRSTLCLLAPRDHGKSAWFSYALVLWLAHVRFPGEYGAMVGEGDVALTHLQHIKLGTPNQELPGIVNTPALAHLRPNGKEGWTNERVDLTNGSRIWAKGAKAAWRGKHPAWCIIDDLLSQDCLFSATERKRTHEKFTSELLPMVRGPVFVVGTPLHAADIYAYCKKQRAYIYREFPALSVDEETGKEVALWPKRFTVEQLHRIRDTEIGPLAFSREYMCKAISSISSLFPEELFQPPVMDDSFTLRPAREWVRERCTAGRFIAMDVGISANIGADYTVIFVVGLDESGNRYLIDLIRERGMGFQRIIKTFIATGAKYAVDAGLIESNQAQAFVGAEAISQSPFPIDMHQTGTEKHLWDRGVPSLRMLFENKKYRLPRGNAESISTTNTLIHELQAHTLVDGKVRSTAKHKDTVMAMWFIELLLRRMSYGGAFFEEEEGDAEALLDYWGDDPDLDSLVAKDVAESFRPGGTSPVPTGEDILYGTREVMGSDEIAKLMWDN